MPRIVKLTLLVLGVAALIPGAAHAQDSASIAGSVADSTGGVLPGVTVVASSPALIEGSRTVVTDGAGAYRIVALRPGTYSVTFTLPGFSTVVREGVTLEGSFAAAVDVQLSVGSVEETVTVTGAAPIVDVQQAQQQEVFDSGVLDAIPTGRTVQNVAVLVPAVVSSQPSGVGGTDLLDLAQLSVHGGETDDFRIQSDGFILGNAYQSYNGFVPNLGATAETTVNTAGAGSDWWGSGVVLNVIPKEGGNDYSGELFLTGATSDWQSDNLTDRIVERGLSSANSLKDTYDINPSYGGPIVQDRLWFYASGRFTQSRMFAGGTYYNKNAGDPNNFFYEPDFDRQAFHGNWSNSASTRFTWQASERNKIGISYEYQRACKCGQTGFGTGGWGANNLVTPEGAYDATYPDTWSGTATWTAPLSNRLLLEVGFMARNEKNGSSGPRPAADDPVHDFIPVYDYGTNYAYNGRLPVVASIWSYFSSTVPQARASLSYVTGSHSFKFGFTHLYAKTDRYDTDNNHNLRYGVVSGLGGVFGLPLAANYPLPVLLFQSAAPYPENTRQSETGLYAQDVWTLGQLTLNLGVRFDRYRTTHPSMYFGPGPLTPNRDFTTPDIDHFNQKDITPRVSAVYDLFGTGRTALKVSANKYVRGHSIDIWDGNPAELITRSPLRTWHDGNLNFRPDCDLTSPLAQGPPNFAAYFLGVDFCGSIPSDWGQANYVPNTRFNPDTISGWGNRGWNWEFSAGVQHELVEGISVDVAWFRKVYGNLLAVTNEALGQDGYDQYFLTAPTHEGLPGGGGYEVGPLLDPKPESIAGGFPIANYQTFASDFGDSFQHWNGVDVNLNARMQNGLTLAGGFSTGRASMNDCDVVSSTGPAVSFSLGRPAAGSTASHLLHCDIKGSFITNVKAFGAYIIPRIDVQLSGTFQSIPGPLIEADVTFPGAQITSALGRPPSEGGDVEVQVVPLDALTSSPRGGTGAGSLYGERLHQVDFRVGKIFEFGGTRTAINLDIYNAFNSDAIVNENPTYGATYRDVRRILMARIFKISASFGF
ncbi:MAG: carboxypeptidase regulatory-like domain-containing protein [Acidobacteria bacterium]|nr:carboxypeptidase regulatory-like domain-containing protein [Acidobacteriota bacterium]